MVPIGRDTGCRVDSQVCPQPLLLHGASVAAPYLRAIAVEHHDVPGAKVIAVVALGWVTGRGPEVVEVAGGSSRVVFVVTRRRHRPGLVTAPGGIVVVGELGVSASAIGVVTER